MIENRARPRRFSDQAACQLRDNNISEGRETLKQFWVRFPYSQEAREAEMLLASNLGGEQWVLQPATGLRGHRRCWHSPFTLMRSRNFGSFWRQIRSRPDAAEAKLKLGIAQVRLKQYDQARETFRGLLKGGRAGIPAKPLSGSPESIFARDRGTSFWRRIGPFRRIFAFCGAERADSLFAGMWLEDQNQFDEAIIRVSSGGKGRRAAFSASRRSVARRLGLLPYGAYREATETLQPLVEQHDGDFEPQALYWMGRAAEQSLHSKARDFYSQLCQRYMYSYYCQLARERTAVSTGGEAVQEATPTHGDLPATGDAPQPAISRSEIEQHSAYRRAIELKTLGLDTDAAREIAVLADRYSRDPDVLIALSTMFNEVGAYHHALRLVRARFRDQLERTGGLPSTRHCGMSAIQRGCCPRLRLQVAKGVDPYLIAAIIREESQYDLKAVSRVGAIGLMQVMPATANNVAQRMGIPAVGRDDLFDQETNIRIGVRYVEQLLKQFSGNLVYTIASYNAGPIAVSTWLTQHRNHSQDEFVELIPYQETRQYVKRVLRSYREYIRLGKAS